MSPSKSGSCRRTTKVQLPSEQHKNGGRKGPLGEEAKGRGEKNIGLAAAAKWEIKPGSSVLFKQGKSKGKKKIYKIVFPEVAFLSASQIFWHT